MLSKSAMVRTLIRTKCRQCSTSVVNAPSSTVPYMWPNSVVIRSKIDSDIAY